jgi:UDP-glucose 6-dehydrogenase
MRVAIVGMGYVGLVTGVCLAEKGHEVTCIDLDEEKVAAANEGRAPIFEAELDELLVVTSAGGSAPTPTYGAPSPLPT